MTEKRPPRIAFCGPGRSGKDACSTYFARITGLRFAGSMSQYLAPFVAAELGIPTEEAFARRHESDAMRMTWYLTGNKLRDADPAKLIRETLHSGEICNGIRDPRELDAGLAEGLIDLLVWVERDVPPDPTQKYGADRCHIVLDNNGTHRQRELRLDALARFAGLGPIAGNQEAGL